LERQINASLYERLLLSNDKESVLAIARKERIPEKPIEIIKDPMYLEFLERFQQVFLPFGVELREQVGARCAGRSTAQEFQTGGDVFGQPLVARY
jgi:hypothetical protein